MLLELPENITNATIVADNLVMAVYFFVTMSIPSILFSKQMGYGYRR